MATYFEVRCPECGETFYIMRGVSYKDSGLIDYGGTCACRICKHKFLEMGYEDIIDARIQRVSPDIHPEHQVGVSIYINRNSQQ